MKSEERKLRLAILFNLIFSTSSGLTLILFSVGISQLMNIGKPMALMIIGFGLLVFGALLAYILFTKTISRPIVKSVILQDWTWVLGSVVLIVAQPFNISLKGNVLIAVVAIIVGTLAILQSKGLKRMN